jgi:hypothetical protein
MSDIVEMLRHPKATQAEMEAAAEIERLRGLVGIESADLDLDWNRLRSGDRRALIADHQDVFDMVTAKENEIERLREENSTLSDSLAAKADRIDRLVETVVRLRGLLREGVEYPGSTQWLQRVREALGDDR